MNPVVPILEVKEWDFLFPYHLWGQLAAGKAAPLQRTWLLMGGSFALQQQEDVFL